MSVAYRRQSPRPTGCWSSIRATRPLSCSQTLPPPRCHRREPVLSRVTDPTWERRAKQTSKLVRGHSVRSVAYKPALKHLADSGECGIACCCDCTSVRA